MAQRILTTLEFLITDGKFTTKPNLIDPESAAQLLWGWIITLILITFMMVVLRLFAKSRTKLGLGLDDTFIVIATALAIALSVNYSYAPVYGWGLHVWDFVGDLTWVQPVRKNVFIAEALLLPTVCFTKLSILIFYHRLFPKTSRKLHIAIYIGMAYSILQCFSTFMAAVFQCVPVHAFWDPKVAGQCFQSYPPQLATAILNSIGDFYIVLLPMAEVWSMTLPLGKKLSLIALFGLGIIVCAAGCVRIYYVQKTLYKAVDFTWYGAYLYIATAVEADIGIIMACMPAVRTLYVSDKDYSHTRSLKSFHIKSLQNLDFNNMELKWPLSAKNVDIKSDNNV